MQHDLYASGPYTRISFALGDGGLVILVPKRHALGDKGDLIHTIISLCDGGPRIDDLFYQR